MKIILVSIRVRSESSGKESSFDIRCKQGERTYPCHERAASAGHEKPTGKLPSTRHLQGISWERTGDHCGDACVSIGTEFKLVRSNIGLLPSYVFCLKLREF